MTCSQADVPAALTGRMSWDHAWHESKTSPCAVQDSPSARSTVSRTAPGCARCPRGEAPAWPVPCGGEGRPCPCGQGCPRGACSIPGDAWGCCSPPTPAPRGHSAGTVPRWIWCCLAGEGFPGFKGSPGCGQPPALLGQQRMGLLCHHLSWSGWESAPGAVTAPVHGRVHGLPAAPRLPSVHGRSQRGEQGPFSASASAGIFRSTVDASVNRSLAEREGVERVR